MAEKCQEKQECKKLINSILCGSKEGLTLKQIHDDYDLLTGKPLPLRELGYTHLEDLIHDISDVVRTSWERGVMVVRPVPNEKNQHIINLVSKQKATKPKRGRGRGRGRGGSYGGYSSRPNAYQNMAPRYRYQGPKQQVNRVPRSVPPSIRAAIRTLLKTVPNGLPLEDFQRAFQRFYGSELHSQSLGFNAIIDLVRAVDDIVTVKESASGYRLFLTTRYTNTRSPEDIAPRFRRNGPSSDDSSGLKEVFGANNARNRLTEEKVPRRSFHNRYAALSESQHCGSSFQNQSEFLENIRDTATLTSQHSIGDQSMTSESTVSEEALENDSHVPIRLKKAIQKVLESQPGGIWAATFLRAFKEVHNRDLPFQKLGYQSVILLMSELNEIVTIDRPGSGDYKLYDARKPIAKQKADNQRTDFDSGDGQAQQTKQRDERQAQQMKQRDERQAQQMKQRDERETLKQCLRDALLENSTGVYLTELPAVFQECSGEVLDLSIIGCNTLEDLLVCDFLQDAVTFEYKGEGRLRLRGIPSGAPIPPPRTANSKPKTSNIPLDAVGSVGVFKQQMPDDAKSCHFMFASNVQSPGRLWLQLFGEDYSIALELLMRELDVYKSPELVEYDLPECFIQTKQVCVAIFPSDGNWHRATMTGAVQDNEVEVYYVDYGGYGYVPKDGLKFIKSTFMELPAQAMKGRLANLQPADGTWSAESHTRMLGLVRDTPLYSIILHTSSDNVLSVCLCNTSGSDDIHINDILVAEGYARNVPDVYDSPESSTVEPDRRRHPKNNGSVSETGSNDSRSSIRTNSITSASEMGDEYVRNVKFVQLTEDYMIHMIKHEDAPYAMSSEISTWIWEKDLLRSMLRQRKADKERVLLKYEDFPGVFEELKEYEVKGILDGDEMRQHVTLYHFSIIIEILELFEHPVEELKSAIEKELAQFNPNDSYWRGDDVEDDDVVSDEFVLDAQDLEIALQQLDLQRKKTLQLLQQDAVNSTQYVNELDQIERRLVNVRARLRKAMSASQLNGKFTDEEKLIQECVDEQYLCSSQLKSKVLSKDEERKTTTQSLSPNKYIQTNIVAPMPVLSQSKQSESCASSIFLPTVTSSSSFPAMASTFGVSNGDSYSAPSTQANALAQQQALFQAQLFLTTQMMGSHPQMGVNMDPSPNMPFGLNQNLNPNAPLFNPMMGSVMNSGFGQSGSVGGMNNAFSQLNMNSMGGGNGSIGAMGNNVNTMGAMPNMYQFGMGTIPMNNIGINPFVPSFPPPNIATGVPNMASMQGNNDGTSGVQTTFGVSAPDFSIPPPVASIPSNLNPSAEPFAMSSGTASGGYSSGFGSSGMVGLGRGRFQRQMDPQGKPSS